MKISTVVIDDEPLARKGLKEYIADVDFLELAGEFDSPLKAAGMITRGEAQLLLLDIQMPKITGLDFFRNLQNPPPVIFTTAYAEYALEGFELNALDYLLKPISFERFFKAACRVREYYELREENREGAAAHPGEFYIKVDGKLVRIPYDDVLFAEAMQNYVVIHTTDRKYMSYLTLKSLEEYLPADRFVKVHKSFIVSAAKISSIDGNDIWVGQNQIPISRTLKDEVMDRLLKGRYLKR
ncbi:MAG: response regulator transcription factor [Chitinophagaceae bacterium]|nr:response regulator transcription factor [Chitinophagaceae bacterium]MBL0335331.1 response regulator transcription factor [Chitinophagaceae bacterium]